MKVTHNTVDRLIIDYRPWFMSLVICAAILITLNAGLGLAYDGDRSGYWIVGGGIIGGAVFFAAFVERNQAVFDRREMALILRKRSVFGYRETRWPLGDVERAIIETMSDSDTEMHRATILLSNQKVRRVPITSAYGTGDGAEVLRDTINDWLATLDSEARTP